MSIVAAELRERLKMFTDRLALCSGPDDYTAILDNEVEAIEELTTTELTMRLTTAVVELRGALLLSVTWEGRLNEADQLTGQPKHRGRNEALEIRHLVTEERKKVAELIESFT